MASEKTTVNQEINKLIRIETTTSDPVCRRVIRDERLKLQSAVNARPVDRQAIGEQLDEARRVRAMWSK